MDKDTILLLGAVISSPVLVALLTLVFNKRKSEVETHNLNITGEVTIGEMYYKYAIQQQKDKEELRKEFTEKINELKQDHAQEILILKTEFGRITQLKDERIKTLENRVSELENETARYKSPTT